jgi:hypothetical protein
LFRKRIKGKGGIEKMGWEIIDRLREERWFVFLFSVLLLALNVGCGKKSSGGEGISNKEISKMKKYQNQKNARCGIKMQMEMGIQMVQQKFPV